MSETVFAPEFLGRESLTPEEQLFAALDEAMERFEERCSIPNQTTVPDERAYYYNYLDPQDMQNSPFRVEHDQLQTFIMQFMAAKELQGIDRPEGVHLQAQPGALEQSRALVFTYKFGERAIVLTTTAQQSEKRRVGYRGVSLEPAVDSAKVVITKVA